jgi:hypothetical protein
MKKRPSEIKVPFATLRQVKRSSTAAIYAVEGENGRCLGYEVIVIGFQMAGTRTFAGKEVKVEEKELYPPTSSWGKRGWSCTTLKEATEKFNEL